VADGQGAAADHLGIGVCGAVFATIAQFGGPVPHRGQYQMRLLTVKGLAGEHSSRLDEQHRLIVGI
jgi:hypothetical protein